MQRERAARQGRIWLSKGLVLLAIGIAYLASLVHPPDEPVTIERRQPR